MRIRRKPWARPELEVCDYYIPDGRQFFSKWREKLQSPIYIELGCGKGGFISQAAKLQPEISFIAADIKSEMLAFTRRKAVASYGTTPSNLTLLTLNIEHINEVFDENEVDRIYINFPPPWRRAKEFKHRLTHTNQLVQYRKILVPGGEIRFKTDDDILFEDSIEYFKQAGFDITRIERDLHNADYPENIITEHEAMFSAEGKKIKFLTAV
ncbi:MAG: tRNA (guanosine(46)-N7)-methyltransferase TrmB [Ruminococcus sp.]|jgi:tRNA (guanine-N7-)-methyltransferase|nr:tRNA (guanosine(46)-N7)-methyltransferase TrmB [Ruminococcus sp.]